MGQEVCVIRFSLPSDRKTKNAVKPPTVLHALKKVMMFSLYYCCVEVRGWTVFDGEFECPNFVFDHFIL